MYSEVLLDFRLVEVEFHVQLHAFDRLLEEQGTPGTLNIDYFGIVLTLRTLIDAVIGIRIEFGQHPAVFAGLDVETV